MHDAATVFLPSSPVVTGGNQTDYLAAKLKNSTQFLARRLSRGTDLYEDMAQEGFQAICGAIGSYRDGRGATLETFALSCARNRMLDYVKREHRHNRLLVSGDSAISEDAKETLFDAIPSGEPSPWDIACTHDLELRLGTAMNGLPRRERHCIERFFLDEMKPDTIAAESGISRPRVHQLIKQGLTRLRRILGSGLPANCPPL